MSVGSEEGRGRGGASLFGRLLDGVLHARTDAVPPQGPSGPGLLEAAERELEAAVDSVRERASQLEQPARESAASEDGEARPMALRRRAVLLASREAQRAQLETDILALHEKLRTGLDLEKLVRLRRMLEAHRPLRPQDGRTIAERVERHTLRRLYL